jgi:hypothetical protein
MEESMKFALALMFVIPQVYATEPPAVTVSAPDLFCTIEGFSSRKVKDAFKKCESLKDKAQTKVKSLEECKTRATDKAKNCLKVDTSTDQIVVKGKFVEKFSVSSKSTTFNCELDNKGGQSCP